MMRLAGFDFTPPPKSGASAGSSVPEARPVYIDDEGNHFALVPDDAGVAKQPISPRPPTNGSQPVSSDTLPTGFVAADRMPDAPTDDGASELIGGMLQQLPTDMATDWLGPAAMKAILAGGCGGMGDSALAAMGLNNPLASGPMAGMLGAALNQAGLGELNSCMPSLGSAIMGGSTAGLANAMGRQGMNSLLGAAGLDQIPGAGFVANALGDQIGAQLQDIFTGGLDSLTDSLSDSLSGVSVDSMMADAETAIKGIDPAAVQSAGVDMAADQLLSEWKVDDESSAAEHIANKAVKDHAEHLKGAAKDPSGFMKKMNEFFSGVAAGTGQPAVRIGDLDDGADASAMGVANILFQGSPVSRLTDLVAGPKAPPPGKKIIIGEPSVLSANLPTAFLGAMTEVPTLMAKGAPTVLVGGATAAAMQRMLADRAKASASTGPTGPRGSASDSAPGESKKPLRLSGTRVGEVTVSDAEGNKMKVPVYMVDAEGMGTTAGYYLDGVIYMNENQYKSRLFGLGDPELTAPGYISFANELQHAKDDAFDGELDGTFHDELGNPLTYLEREARSDDASARAAENSRWPESDLAPTYREAAEAMRTADLYLQQAHDEADPIKRQELLRAAKDHAAASERALGYIEGYIEWAEDFQDPMAMLFDPDRLTNAYPGRECIDLD